MERRLEIYNKIEENIKKYIRNDKESKCYTNNYEDDCLEELWYVSENIVSSFEDKILSFKDESKRLMFERYYELFLITSIFISDKLLNDEQYCTIDVIIDVVNKKYTEEIIYKAETILLSHIKYSSILNYSDLL